MMRYRIFYHGTVLIEAPDQEAAEHESIRIARWYVRSYAGEKFPFDDFNSTRVDSAVPEYDENT